MKINNKIFKQSINKKKINYKFKKLYPFTTKNTSFLTGSILFVQTKYFITIKEKYKESVKKKIRKEFLGLCIAFKKKQLGSTITLRNIINGTGIDLTLPLNSPLVNQIYMLNNSKLKKSKLYYIRQKPYKSTKVRKKTYIHKLKNILL